MVIDLVIQLKVVLICISLSKDVKYFISQLLVFLLLRTLCLALYPILKLITCFLDVQVFLLVLYIFYILTLYCNGSQLFQCCDPLISFLMLWWPPTIKLLC